jgi:hypothetical protein
MKIILNSFYNTSPTTTQYTPTPSMNSEPPSPSPTPTHPHPHPSPTTITSTNMPAAYHHHKHQHTHPNPSPTTTATAHYNNNLKFFEFPSLQTEISTAIKNPQPIITPVQICLHNLTTCLKSHRKPITTSFVNNSTTPP